MLETTAELQEQLAIVVNESIPRHLRLAAVHVVQSLLPERSGLRNEHCQSLLDRVLPAHATRPQYDRYRRSVDVLVKRPRPDVVEDVWE